MQAITVNLSEPLFQRAQLAADKLRKPIDEVISNALERTLPKVFQSSDLDEVPAEMKAELAAMAQFSDEALISFATSTFPRAKQRQMDKLLYQQNAGTLAEAGLATLKALAAESGRHMLRRGQALALLVERGHAASEFLPAEKKR